MEAQRDSSCHIGKKERRRVSSLQANGTNGAGVSGRAQHASERFAHFPCEQHCRRSDGRFKRPSQPSGEEEYFMSISGRSFLAAFDRSITLIFHTSRVLRRRGGKEFGCSVYVSNVVPSSKAAQYGLKAGDELIRVNGLTLLESTHEEVANLIRLKKTITLTVRAVGMIPDMRPGSNAVGWKVVAEEKPKSRSESLLKSTKRVQVTVDQEAGMGAKIYCDGKNGVSIVSVTPNSALQHAGLQAGDVIVEVNGNGLLNVSQSEAVRLLKSSNVLVLTVRVDDEKSEGTLGDSDKRSGGGGVGGGGGGRRGNGHYNPFDNPPEDFELRLQDVDLDAELVPNPGQESTGFELKSRDGAAPPKLEVRQKKQDQWERFQSHLSVLGMEVEEQSKMLPGMASPAADGYGFALSLPTLMSMFPAGGHTDPDGEEGDASFSGLLTSPERPGDEQDRRRKPKPDTFTITSSTLLTTRFTSTICKRTGVKEEQPDDLHAHSGAGIEAGQRSQSAPLPQGRGGVRTEAEQLWGHEEEQYWGPAVLLPPAPMGVSKSVSSDLSSYQFPVDEEEVPATPPPPPPMDKAPSGSALKKTTSDTKARTKKPSFSDSVEIIGMNESTTLSAVTEAAAEGVHPSNMEFSQEVLNGREVAFHTVPKTAPLKIAIRGGTDTPLGGQIIISQILEGGAAAQYGRLHVGDQILVCDGVSLLEVTHNEAAQALKRAIDMESTSIDLVVAVNKAEQEDVKTTVAQTQPLPMKAPVQVNQSNKSGTGNSVQKSALKLHSPITTR
ncbi:hypothetical protein EMCRGX_G009569 [Ephydatia muelleri]